MCYLVLYRNTDADAFIGVCTVDTIIYQYLKKRNLEEVYVRLSGGHSMVLRQQQDQQQQLGTVMKSLNLPFMGL